MTDVPDQPYPGYVLRYSIFAAAYKGAQAANTKALTDIRDTDSAAMNPDSLLDW